MGFGNEYEKNQILPLEKVTDSASEELSIILQRGEIEVVEEFKYLGSISSSSLSMQSELASRLRKAGHAFHKLSKFWQDKYLAKEIKLFVYKTVVQVYLAPSIWKGQDKLGKHAESRGVYTRG